MIPEAIDAGTRIGWAIVAWIVVGAAAGTGLLVGFVVGVWWVGRRVGRVSRYAWQALRKPQAPASRPQALPCGSRDAGTPHGPAQTPSRPAPSWGRDSHERKAA